MSARPLPLVAAAALGLAAFAALAVSRTTPEPAGTASSPPEALAAPEVEWSEPLEVARGEAHEGPWRMNDSDFRYVDAPAAAFAGDGELVVAWVEQERQDVVLQRFDPEGRAVLPEPVNVSRSPDTFSWLPRVVATPGDPGEVHVLWQEIVFSGGSHGGEAFFARSTDGGRSFGEPLNLSGTPAGAGKGRLSRNRWDNGSLDLARGPDGTLYAAWTEYEGALRVSRSTDGGESFAEPVRVAGDHREPARGPALAVGPSADTVRVAWTVGGDPGADLRLATSGDGAASFGEPAVHFPSAGHADAPDLAVGPDGALHVAFAEAPEGPAGGYEVRYARSGRGPSGFGDPVALEGPDSGEPGGAGFPTLGLDGEGRPHLLWERFPSPGSLPRGLGFAWSPDGGEAFAAPAEVPGVAGGDLGVNGSRQGLLTRKLAVGREGELAVVNSTFDPGRESRVLLLRGKAGGADEDR